MSRRDGSAAARLQQRDAVAGAVQPFTTGSLTEAGRGSAGSAGCAGTASPIVRRERSVRLLPERRVSEAAFRATFVARLRPSVSSLDVGTPQATCGATVRRLEDPDLLPCVLQSLVVVDLSC